MEKKIAFYMVPKGCLVQPLGQTKVWKNPDLGIL